MNSRVRHFALLNLLASTAFVLITSANSDSIAVAQDQPFREIERRIPPAGIEVEADSLSELTTRLHKSARALESTDCMTFDADLECLLKAVQYAIELNEFYSPRDLDKAHELLDLFEQRIDSLRSSRAPWTKQTGRVVRGYYSSIDGSAQPYGLEIPESLDLSQPCPLYVWLHGRGDKVTDMHFIHQRMHRSGTIDVENAIVVHPFGRHCIGFKSAGEIDVLEVVEQVKQHYNIDPRRIVLMGFSMGGAGVWHIGAHYPDRWVAMSPGAGFSETAMYNRLDPADYTPEYEQALWRVYDVPNYVRNLFNLPVIAYSGENDKQIQAARVMEEAFKEHGKTLPHVIGPGMGHRYHPDSLDQILSNLTDATDAGLDSRPNDVHLQTRSLRYSRVHWLEVITLVQHWSDTRADASVHEQTMTVSTLNVRRLRIHDSPDFVRLEIDDQVIDVAEANSPLTFVRSDDGQWRQERSRADRLEKRPRLQGPIDDAWLSSFLVVMPSGTSSNERRQEWIEFELAHFRDRWKALFRGELPTKLDSEVTAEDMATRNLIVFGDPTTNLVIRETIDHLPVDWSDNRIQLGDKTYDDASYVPVMIYPNPHSPNRYIVLNSGPTFREGHDRTNSLQNPKLPDWAILDISVAPSDTAAGRIVAADFFDEEWQVRD